MTKESYTIPDFSTFPVFNPKNMETLRQQTRNRPELLKEILDSFIEESHEIIEEIKAHIESNDIDKLSRSVHTLKGLTGTIGASRFYQLLSHIDACHKESDFSNTQNLCQIFDTNLELLISYFKEEGFE